MFGLKHVADASNWRLVGVAPPILTYGPLNALLFVSYNRALGILDARVDDPSSPPSTTSFTSIWLAGAVGGFATWIVSAPTESIKCRAQVTGGSEGSFSIARRLWYGEGTGGPRGLRALYVGGTITSVRDAVGYGFYFWSYELCKRTWSPSTDGPEEELSRHQEALRVLVCGGIAGVATWASIFPLDVVKTRLQTQDLAADHRTAILSSAEQQRLLSGSSHQTRMGRLEKRAGAWEIARTMYHNEGIGVFFRGLGVCSVRAFIVNAVQWTVYEWTMKYLKG